MASCKGPIRELKIQRRGRQREGLISKTTTSHVHHTFLYISFPFLYDYNVKMPYFAFMEDVNKQQRNFISLSEFGSVVISNSVSGGFAYI